MVHVVSATSTEASSYYYQSLSSVKFSSDYLSSTKFTNSDLVVSSHYFTCIPPSFQPVTIAFLSSLIWDRT